jgi:hypothetical protein
MRTLLMTLTIVLAVAAAGCGSNKSPSVADVNSGNGATTTTSSSDSPPTGGGTRNGSGGGPSVGIQLNAKNATELARCMRRNGVPNFPDPSKNGSIQFGSANGIDPNSPKFKSAMQKCQKLLPNGGAPSPAAQKKAQEAALAMSRCMRSHGVKNFPDPQFEGGKVTLGIRGGPGSGLDPNSPTFRRAQRACQGTIQGFKGSPGPTTSSGAK